MMQTISFSASLVGVLSNHHLLKHPFYQQWTEGSLSMEKLRAYARQYFHHVQAFPRYLSATHSQCEVLQARQVLLENLMDEERGEGNHPALWMDFATCLGQSEESVRNEAPLPATRRLVDTFMDFARSSYAEGLGALFAYEHQIPEIASFKLEGLKKNYGISEPRAVAFFEVHRQADVVHTAALAQLIDELPPLEKEKAQRAAQEAAKALWGFLDQMHDLAA